MARKPPNQSQYSRLSPCGHLDITDKSQLHCETHKEMTETNSRCYGNADTLSCPQARHFTCFFSRYSGHLSTSSKILTHITQRIKRRYNKGKNDTKHYRPLLCKRVNEWLYYTAFLELTNILLYCNTLLSKLLDRFLLPWWVHRAARLW